MQSMPPTTIDSLETLRQHVREFAAARAWDRYHTPKNLAMALAVEAAELVEPFQWLTPDESETLDPDKLEAVRQEIADVLIYLTRLADVLEIDPLQAAADKLELNARRYPVEKARGNALKYDEFTE
jgi:NTP pyrophosphatase (non-canonical NTP hydrolase)